MSHILILSTINLSSSAIRSHSPAKPVLIFVSSRRQTRLTALDLIAFLATEDDPKQWLHQDEREVRMICSTKLGLFIKERLYHMSFIVFHEPFYPLMTSLNNLLKMKYTLNISMSTDGPTSASCHYT